MGKITCNIQYDFKHDSSRRYNLFTGLFSLAMHPITKRIIPKITKPLVTNIHKYNKNFIELQKIMDSLNERMPELLEVISNKTNNYNWILEVSLSTHKAFSENSEKISLNHFITLKSATNKKMPRFWMEVIEEPEKNKKILSELKPLPEREPNTIYSLEELQEIHQHNLRSKQYYIVRPERNHLDVSIESFRKYISKINKNTILFRNNQLDSTNVQPFKSIVEKFDTFVKDKEKKGISPFRKGKYGYSYSHEFYIQKELEWSIEINEEIYDGDYFNSPFYSEYKTEPTDILKSIIESGFLIPSVPIPEQMNAQEIDNILKKSKIQTWS